MSKTYYVWPLGCQTNKSDGERVATVLEKLGYERVEDEHDANVIAVIACAIRQSAVDRIYGKFRAWEQRQQAGDLTTLLTGCVLPHDKQKLTPKFDLVFDIEELPKLPLLLAQTNVEETVNLRDQMAYFDIQPIHNSKFRAWVPIAKGCDKFCTYCAVPYTRGRERSRPSADIIQEVKELIAKGYKDIHLLGQNVNSYGMDKRRADGTSEELTFAQLLETVATLPGDFWVRFHAPHPRDFTADVIEVIAKYPKLCKQINLPAQSGSSTILRRMNRPYTREQYLKLTDDIKAGIPNVSLSTDIIVGFCGETEEEFADSKSLMEYVGYDMAFIAQYSVRPGTVAARRFEDNVSHEVKKERFRELTDVLEQTFMVNQQPRLGTVDTILVEKYAKDHWLGRNQHQVTVEFPAPADANLVGTFQQVKLEEVEPFRFKGNLK
ncbi:MAG: tRNA (N6-isopentenyl adenosine(37)-C2)-methylthiotransferase MiaB [Candidatus Kerfeldbacteria bacterium]|nr:tRNA (N6-isopentenyl adenosine(37)-C2)-methylthiotransferase MiaB [Candidatus Kerfeldbacteria bacterium]